MNITLSLKLCNRSLLNNIIPKRKFYFPIHNGHERNNLQCKNRQTPVTCVYLNGFVNHPRLFSTDNKTNDQAKDEKPKVDSIVQDASTAKVSQRTQLKLAVRDYGATVVVFHVAISLVSLGISYLAVSSGVDPMKVLNFLGFAESIVSSKFVVGGSTFVIAYALHKCFAPVRIGITLTCAPFIVRYLRRVGWLKPPKAKK